MRAIKLIALVGLIAALGFIWFAIDLWGQNSKFASDMTFVITLGVWAISVVLSIVNKLYLLRGRQLPVLGFVPFVIAVVLMFIDGVFMNVWVGPQEFRDGLLLMVFYITDFASFTYVQGYNTFVETQE